MVKGNDEDIPAKPVNPRARWEHVFEAIGPRAERQRGPGQLLQLRPQPDAALVHLVARKVLGEMDEQGPPTHVRVHRGRWDVRRVREDIARVKVLDPDAGHIVGPTGAALGLAQQHAIDEHPRLGGLLAHRRGQGRCRLGVLSLAIGNGQSLAAGFFFLTLMGLRQVAHGAGVAVQVACRGQKDGFGRGRIPIERGSL